MTASDPIAYPSLTDDQLARIATYGRELRVEAGDLLFTPSDPDYDFFALIDATVRIVHRAAGEEHVVAIHGPGRFIGDLGLMTGAKPILTAEVERGGRLVRVSHADFRRLLDGEVDLSRILVDAFLARRAQLQQGEGARLLRILGSRFMPEALRLRQFATRMRLPHVWEDLEDHPDVEAMLAAIGVGAADLPVAVTPMGVLRRPTPANSPRRSASATNRSQDASTTSPSWVPGPQGWPRPSTPPPRDSRRWCWMPSGRVARPGPAR